MVLTTDHSERAIQSLLIVGIKDLCPLTENWLIVAVMILVMLPRRCRLCRNGTILENFPGTHTSEYHEFLPRPSTIR